MQEAINEHEQEKIHNKEDALDGEEEGQWSMVLRKIYQTSKRNFIYTSRMGQMPSGGLEQQGKFIQIRNRILGSTYCS